MINNNNNNNDTNDDDDDDDDGTPVNRPMDNEEQEQLSLL